MDEGDDRFRLAAARRMTARESGASSVLGCISMRAADGDGFLVTTPGHADRSTPEGVVQVRAGDGSGAPAAVAPTAAVHALVYGRRPEVGAIVHTHSHHATVVASAGCPIGAFNELSAMYHEEQVCYDDDGDRSPAAMARLADALGDRRVLLLRNHGVIAVGPGIEDVTIDAIALEKAARWHVEAARFGGEEIMLPHIRLSKELYDTYFRANMWTANLRRLRRSDPDLFAGPGGG